MKGGGAATSNQTFNRSMYRELTNIDANSSDFSDFTNLSRQSDEQTKELQLIDREIILILRLLTPYFLFESCHKVLEFLIRFYKIHLNYSLFVLECCFPYYNTTTFARLIQILEFNSPKWQILFLNVKFFVFCFVLIHFYCLFSVSDVLFKTIVSKRGRSIDN